MGTTTLTVNVASRSARISSSWVVIRHAHETYKPLDRESDSSNASRLGNQGFGT